MESFRGVKLILFLFLLLFVSLVSKFRKDGKVENHHLVNINHVDSPTPIERVCQKEGMRFIKNKPVGRFSIGSPFSS